MAGVLEKVQDRSQCGKPGVHCSSGKLGTSSNAPQIPSQFGRYVAGVCGHHVNYTRTDPISGNVTMEMHLVETGHKKVTYLWNYICLLKLVVK